MRCTQGNDDADPQLERVENKNGPFPCFTRYNTLADLLENKKIPWRFYAPAIGGLGGIYNTFDAIKWVRDGPDWTSDVISPQTKILTDLPKQLAAVTWITPTGKDSDHPNSDSDTGPSWVANIVNAIGQSPYWNSTAIVVLWDDWGGWYDHVSPPQLDYLGLSYRVPMLVISPYAKKGYVSHTQFEFGSILKFTENVFNLPSFGLRTNAPTDSPTRSTFRRSPAPSRRFRASIRRRTSSTRGRRTSRSTTTRIKSLPVFYVRFRRARKARVCFSNSAKLVANIRS